MILPEYIKDVCHYSLSLIYKIPEDPKTISVEMATHKTNICFQKNVEAGPFVKFDGVAWEDTPKWRVSMLLITKEGGVPPYLSCQGRKVSPEEVFSTGSQIIWKYPLEVEMDNHASFIDYSLGGEEFSCYVPSVDDSWIVQYVAKGVAVEEEISDDEDDDGIFGSIIAERTALHVIQVSSEYFQDVFGIPEIQEWMKEPDKNIQLSKLMNEPVKLKVASYFLKTFCSVFNKITGKVTPHVALSGGKPLIDSVVNKELVDAPYIQEVINIERIFKNVFFHHSADSTILNETAQPYVLYDLNHFHCLSMDLNVVRTRNKWMLNRTWRALFSELVKCCEAGAKNLVININSPLVYRGKHEESKPISLWSYINPIEYLPKESCQYEWQLENFLKTLESLQDKFSVKITILSHFPEVEKLFVLKLRKKSIDEKEKSDSTFRPVNQRLVIVNDVLVSDNQGLRVSLGLSNEIEVTDSQGIVISNEDNGITSLDDLTLKEQGGWKILPWPFKS